MTRKKTAPNKNIGQLPGSKGACKKPIDELLLDTQLSDTELMSLLQVTPKELARWKNGIEPHHLTKRGIVQVLRQALKISNTSAKYWEITLPNGDIEIVKNLRAWCFERKLPFSSMCSNISARGWYGKHETYRGRVLTTEELKALGIESEPQD